MTMTRYAIYTTVLAGALMLGGCEAPKPDEPVEALFADPARLKEVKRLCREDRKQVSEQTCRNAAIADGKRFRGSGKTKYTPQNVEMFSPEKKAR